MGLHTCTAVARSLCVSWAFLLFIIISWGGVAGSLVPEHGDVEYANGGRWSAVEWSGTAASYYQLPIIKSLFFHSSERQKQTISYKSSKVETKPSFTANVTSISHCILTCSTSCTTLLVLLRLTNGKFVSFM